LAATRKGSDRLSIDLSDASGTWDFDSAGDFLANVPNRFRQNFLDDLNSAQHLYGDLWQDEWRLKPNFVLSYGLRYENETILIDKNNFGPRVAFSWILSSQARQ